MVVERRVYSCLILSMTGNWPFFLHTVIFIVSAFCIWCCLVAPGLTWEPDVMFGESFVLWCCGGGGGGEAKGCQQWAGPGGAPWSWAGERESTSNGALGILGTSKLKYPQRNIKYCGGVCRRGYRDCKFSLPWAQVKPSGTPLSLHVQTCSGILE